MPYENPPVLLANNMPQPETKAPDPGVQPSASRSDHSHPRLTSVQWASLDANGEATVNFTRAFSAKPGMDFTTEDDVLAQPVTVKVIKDSWIKDTSGNFTGCRIKGQRAQVLPSVLLNLGALLNFNIFGGSAASVMVSVIAIQQS